MTHGARWIAVGLLLAWPSPSRACSPGISGHIDVLAPAGSTHPANGVITLRGYNFATRHLTALVDGEVARLVPVPELGNRFSYYERLVRSVRLEPQPRPGQVVRILGQPCEFVRCEVDFTYTATEPDEEAPPSFDASWDASLPVLTEEEAWSGGLCEPLAVAGVTASLRLPALAEPVLARIEVWRRSPEGDAYELLGGSRRVEPILASSDRLEVGTRLFASGAGWPVDLSELCVAVALVDAAGNTTEVERCAPCRVRRTEDEDATCHPEARYCMDDDGPGWAGDVCCSIRPTPPGRGQLPLALTAALVIGAARRRRRGLRGPLPPGGSTG